MCGIAGIFEYRSRRTPELSTLRAMADRMAHRGPDGEGFFARGGLGLAHRRLSIIDLAGGRQPLENEDGTVVVSFNGEIYSYRRLARDLEQRGHVLRTRSDTEVVVHAYEERGEGCVSVLDGMFAFAIADTRRERLLLARDRLGIKPLYYVDDGERIVFASEIGAILACPGVRRDADPAAARLYLAMGFVPAPRTGLRGIMKLPPGHVLVCDASSPPRVARYWRRPLGPASAEPVAALADDLAARLDETVGSHLMSDVPLGVLLSGGIDSTTILGLTSRRMREPVRTFSVYFGEGAYYDETPHARLAARRFGAVHRELLLTPRGFADELVRAVRHMEEPVTEAAAVPLLALSRMVREDVTVVLSGEGADEDFGGYEIYRLMLGLEALHRLPYAGAVAGRALRALGFGKAARYARLASLPLERRYRGVSLPDLDALEPLLLPAVREEAEALAREAIEPVYEHSRGAHPLERMLLLDIELWLPDDILLKADKMTMAASVELRVPFLDHHIVGSAALLPPHLKVGLRRGKRILRRAVRPLVPAAILERPKRGFPVPLAALFRGELGALAERVLAGTDACGHGLWSEERVAGALRAHRASRADHHRALFAILVYELWHRELLGVGSGRAVAPQGDARRWPRPGALPSAA